MRFRLAPLTLVCALSIMGTTLAPAQKLQPPGVGQPQGENQPQGQLIDRPTPESTINLLKQAGYTDLQFYTDNQGNKQVQGKINGQGIAVVHYYEKGVCQQFISFVAPLGKQQGIDLNWINSWNYDKLFAKLSQDNEGNIFVQMDVHLFGGVSPGYVTGSGELFGELIKALYQYQPGK
jgi:Putative bacterial sensory transduction regulator